MDPLTVWTHRQLESITTEPVVLVHDPADVQVDQDSEGLVSVVRVQASCALTAATRALMAAILLYMLTCFVDWWVLPREILSSEGSWQQVVKDSRYSEVVMAPEEKKNKL